MYHNALQRHYQNPVFSLFSKGHLSSVANLDPELTINGTAVEPTFRYTAVDADSTDWDAWDYGETLTANSVGGVTFNDGSPLLGTYDDSVKFDGTGYFQADNDSFADITTEDFVIEVVFIATATTIGRLINKYASSTGYVVLESGGTGQLVFTMGDGTTAAVATTALTEGAWYHALLFVNRDEASTNGSQWYINGLANGSGQDLSAKANITVSSALTIAAGVAGNDAWDKNIAYCAMWKQSDWHQAGAAGPTEWADVAKARFLKLTGFYPQKSEGSPLPTTFTRDDIAYLDKCSTLTPTELLTDGDMEAGDTSAWTVINSATLTKENSPRTNSSGSYSLRVAYNGINHPQARQYGIASAGTKYRVTGWARGDGTAYPTITWGAGGSIFWTGTASTVWQEIDTVVVADGAGDLSLRSYATAAGYSDFDDISVTEIPTRELYKVGENWLRFVSRTDSNGDFITGGLIEQSSENVITYSQKFDEADWHPVSYRANVTDGYTAPDGSNTAWSLEEDGTAATTHYIYNSASVVSGSVYSFSLFVKAENRSWVRFIFGAASGAVLACFDVTNGTLGTTSAGVTGKIESWGDGWYRCIMTWTADANEEGVIAISIAEADNDIIFDGQNQVSLYIWGVQVEATDYPTSYFPTTSAADTRAADTCVFKGDDGNISNNQQGALICQTLMPNFNNAIDKLLIELSDGGVTTDRIALLINSNDVLDGYTRAAGSNDGDIVGSNDVVDGEIHNIQLIWEADRFRAYLDGIQEGSTDTNCGVPNDIDRLSISQSNGVVSNICIFRRPTRT